MSSPATDKEEITLADLMNEDFGEDRFLLEGFIPADGAVVILASWPKNVSVRPSHLPIPS
jgi:hypothetical protein